MQKIVTAIIAATLIGFAASGAAAAFEAPPAEFDHAANNMRTWHYPAAQVSDLCRRLVIHPNNPYRAAASEAGVIGGCAIGGPAQCVIIMPQRSSVTAASYNRLFRHERAHCNGWRH